MLEQSSLPFFSHSIYSTDENYNNEINSDKEFFNFEHGKEAFNEILTWTDDDTSDTSSISSINFEDLENFENEIIDYESNNEIFEQEIEDEIIDDLKFTPCVIIDFINGKMQRFKEVNSVLSKLGVCNSHFQFDNKYLHKQNKQLKDFKKGIIQWRRCISCDKYITFFSRGISCNKHSWQLNKQNIQVPYIRQYICKVLRSYPPYCKQVFDDIKKPLCICYSCYENLGGHIYHRPGRGKSAITCITENLHDDDTNKGLEFFENWLINIAQTDNDEIKKNILVETFKTFLPFASPLNQKFTNNISISTKEKSFYNELPIDDFEEFGHMFGQKLWDSCSDVNLKKSALESPQTIQEYYNFFPEFLNRFFYGVIDELYQKKLMVCNWQRKRHEKSLKTTNFEEIIKIVTFITSILLGLVFPYLKIWLPRVLTSLSRIPRLLGSFRQILTVYHVTSHTDRYERKLAKTRIENSDSTKRLIQDKNIWNLAVIDNIDFKEKSFKFGNIYDITRGNSHATLRMVFQAQLPFEIETGPEPVIELTAETPLFGMNSGINETLSLFQNIIYELLDFKKINNELIYKTNFDAEVIKNTILSRIDYGCLGPTPNIVILEPGANPNSDEEILRVVTMYKKDFTLENHSFLDIVGDEALHRRLIKCREEWPGLRPLLGQWHTSKDLCSVLLVLFSSYGLFSLASRLGVRFLDKFEAGVDYRSTSRVLDLIWVAVGVAINIYIAEKGILLDEIMEEENNTHISHRTGMRVGNFDLQRNSLSAAGPLFASAAKSNYTTAIAHFLSTIVAYPRLEEKLRYCGAFKISNKDRHICFGFDEALETFGVRFIKQNIINVIASVRKQLSEVWTIKKVRDWWNYHKDK
ncbi:hypothetical protein Glove_23g147 [Diversispora epigaea]|uniref:Uncharacterized protein n=1 Tax=Diversispora epigaea TaxID=1348612 RepID=A0A397JQW0_9GLOM|nr:hypothetical protein Glove_23g147 [Diversispora epigaea]